MKIQKPLMQKWGFFFYFQKRKRISAISGVFIVQ